MKKLIPLLLPVLLGACTTSPSPVLPPVKLTVLKPEFKVASQWKIKIGDGVSENYLKLAPAVAGDTGYAADYRGQLRAFNVVTGKTLWQKDYAKRFSSAPVVTAHYLFIGTSQGELFAIDRNTGDVLWQKQMPSEVLAPVASNGEVVIVKSVDGSLQSLRASDGKQNWLHSSTVPALTLRGQSAPVLYNEMVLFADDEGKVTALTLNDGNVLWERVIAIPRGGTELARMIDIDATPVIHEDVLYVTAYQGRLAAVSLLSGRLLWVRELSSHTGLAVDPYRLYLSDSEGQVWAVDRKSGATLWKQDKLLRRALTGPVLQQGYLAVADFNGFIHWLAREDGRLVARTRMSHHGTSDEEEDFEELEFAKWNNILAVPYRFDDTLLLSMDRIGWLEAFKLAKP